MAVFRLFRRKDFTVMSNHHFRNKRLSLKAMGLLSLMLFLPDEWDYTLKGLTYLCSDGIDSIRSAVNELEKFGYLDRHRIRNEKGQLTETEYSVYEIPPNEANHADIVPEEPADRHIKEAPVQPALSESAKASAENSISMTPAMSETNNPTSEKLGIFDVAQSVVNSASGVISADTSIDLTAVTGDLEDTLAGMEIGGLFGLWFQSLFVRLTMCALSACIFVVIYGRMIEVYLVTSMAPIPMAAMLSRSSGGMGQNYLRSLFALAFQAFLIIVCVAIYAVLVQNIAVDDDISAAIWTCMAYTILLCFTLFKTGSLSKSLFAAH